MKTHVIYHGNCYDGFGASWAAWKHFGNSATYAPAFYGVEPNIPDGTEQIYLLDFSYPKKIIKSWLEEYRVIILDHHQTTIDDLKDLLLDNGPLMGSLDERCSGAVLTWGWFFPEKETPLFLDYIEDRDLWKFELAYSAEFTAALRSYPMDFGQWDRLADGDGVYDLINEGEPILRAQANQVEIMAKQATMGTIDGWDVPIVNTTVYFSEVGQRLLELFPNAMFSAYYFDRADGVRQWGLRSGDDFDCSVVAKRLGGGGHPQASGFTTKAPRSSPLIPPLDREEK